MKDAEFQMKKASTKQLLNAIRPGNSKQQVAAATAEWLRRAKTAAKKAERKATQ